MKNRSRSTKGILAQPRVTMVAALVAACLGSEAYALGFGRMRVQSALGQPLRAEVELIDANSSNLRAGTAPASAYAQKGLEYSSAAKGIRASVRKMPDGRAVLVLNSDAPINDPFVDVVLQASDGSGSVTRDFSLLLDPPATTRAPVNVVEPATPRTSASTRAERMVLPPADGIESERTTTTSRRKSASRVGTRSGAVRVRRGDTAGQIAARNRPARVSLDQMLVALQRANSHAFINGNVNLLKSGVVLKMPSAAEARAVSAAEARAIITAQSEDFRNYRGQLARAPMAPTTPGAQQSGGRIQSRVEDSRTSPATAPDTLTISKADIKANNVPEQRMAEAMQQRDNINRADELNKNLSDLKNISAEVAASAQPGTPLVVVPPVADVAIPASNMASEAAASEMVGDAASAAVAAASDAASAAEQAASKGVNAASAAASKPAPRKKSTKPPVVPKPKEPSFLESLMQSPLLLGGVGLAALGGLGYMLFTRRRKQNQEESGSTFFESNYAPDSFFEASGGEDVNTSESVTTAGMGTTYAGQSSMLYSPSQLDADADVDPVAEADVYLAYGRDAQAEEILKDALLKHPESVAVHAKLLEVYARRRDVKAYAQAATVFKQLTQGEGSDWEAVRTQGAEMDPGNALYVDSAAAKPAAPAVAPAVVEPVVAMGMAAAVTAPEATAPSAPPVQQAPAAQSNQEFDLMNLSPATVPSVSRLQRHNDPAPALDLSLDMPETQPAMLQPETAPVVDQGLEFSMSGLSLDSLQPDSGTGADSSHPLETKLALAREFMGIGDNEGARIMAQEVAQNATGDLKAEAEALLASLH